MKHGFRRPLATGISALALLVGTAQADQQFLDDVIVDGSLCVGQDCVNGENFGFDTIRLKENNLRIRAVDTSNSGSFPTRDWQITFNDSTNGGQDKFSIDDIDAGRTPFTIEASAPSHSLYVDDGGRIGLGTATPVVEMHVVDGDSPTLRLEQDGSSGFTPQTWDVAGNETNFFVRDATNGSRLPFKIRPSAPTNSIYVDTDGDIGLGTASPDAGLHITSGSLLLEEGDGGAGSATLHVRKSDGSARILIEETAAAAGTRQLLEMKNKGNLYFSMTETGSGFTWNVQQQVDNSFRITNGVSAGEEFLLSSTGDLSISGGLVTGTAGNCTAATPCDLVFDPEVYTVASIEDHAASMWGNQHLPAVGPTRPNEPVHITSKLLGMLNELEHAHIYIEQLNTRVKDLETQLAMVQAE
ncbi:MAG: hypothetical protein P1U91_15585 [Pseudophaeobacter sp. bin_em_oilr2.035]|nr:hypothetical protein [Pseudophaeobacter sp. bin_em_oilr2.035]